MKLRHQLRRFGSRVWSGWPDRAYRKESYRQRLSAVQRHLADCLDTAPHGPLHITSMCAGDGRDVIGVVAAHERRNDLVARLVELNRRSVAAGIRHAASARLETSIEFLEQDATDYSTYTEFALADIVLVCGVWGHVPIHERAQLLQTIATLCKPGGAVIWTRGVSRGMQRLREIQSLFDESSWNQAQTTITADQKFSVTTHRYRGPALPRPKSGRIFNFQRSAGG